MTVSAIPEDFEPGELRDEVLSLELMEVADHPAHKVPTIFFRMVEAGGEEVGAINLRVGSNRHIERYGGHVGYSVHLAHRGHGYAARAIRLLMPLSRKMGFEEIWITCDPENTASRRSCEIAGATLEGIVDVPTDCIIHRHGHPRKCRYKLTL